MLPETSMRMRTLSIGSLEAAMAVWPWSIEMAKMKTAIVMNLVLFTASFRDVISQSVTNDDLTIKLLAINRYFSARITEYLGFLRTNHHNDWINNKKRPHERPF